MQVTEHFSELGRWRVAQRGADRRLRAYVHGYLGSEGYVPITLRERHLPSAEAALLVNFGPPRRTLDVADPNRWTTYRKAWVVGLYDHALLGHGSGSRRPQAHLTLECSRGNCDAAGVT